ncbi:recombinase family protein [Spirillospora sp. CA-128828]|uniref:recombinase family protein n=1 Tax=Spirillospora sp. CA-128828 TaxID=3240033 RepID=UPI003D8FCB8B
MLNYARPGDTVHISEMFRLVRGTQHILDVLDVLHRDRLALRIHDGAFSAMDLTARHPRTGELLSTVKFMVQTLAAAGELQRDLQRELTYDGLRAAQAKGHRAADARPSRLRRPPPSAPPTWRAGPSPPWPASTASAGRHPHRHHRPHARAHRGLPREHPGDPGAAGHPRHAGQGR